jgi:hypothetical protein
MHRSQIPETDLHRCFTFPLTLCMAWVAFALAVVVAYWGLAVGRVSLDLIYHADALYLPALYRDLASGQDFGGWSLPPAPYYFPDMLVFFGLNRLLGDFRFAILAYGLTQVLLFIFGLISVCRLINSLNPHTPGFVLLAGALFFLYFYTARFHILALTLVSAHHFGVIVVGTGCLALVTSTFDHPHIDGKVVLQVLVAQLFSTLTVASDMLYVIHFLVPAMLSVCLLLALREITYRRVLVYGSLCLSLPMGNVLNRVLTDSDTAVALPSFSFQNLQAGLLELIAWVQSFWLPHPRLSLAAICFVLTIGFVLTVVVRERKRCAKAQQRLFVLSFLVFQLFACVLSVLYLGKVTQRYLLPLIIMPTFFGWPLLIAAACKPVRILNNQLGIKIVAFGVVLICGGILARIGISPQLGQLVDYYPDVVRCMDDQTQQRHLHNGLSNYWQAKYISMLSHNGLHVIQIDADLRPFYWVNNRHWYEQPFEFIVIDPRQPEGSQLDRWKIIDHFGWPNDSFWCGSSEILIYHSAQFQEQFHVQMPANWR